MSEERVIYDPLCGAGGMFYTPREILEAIPMRRDIVLTSAEFADLRDLRTAQRTFFATPHWEQSDAHRIALINARRLEKRIDAIIDRIVERERQAELFEMDDVPGG